MNGVNDWALHVCQVSLSVLLTLSYLILIVTPCLQQDAPGYAEVIGNPQISEAYRKGVFLAHATYLLQSAGDSATLKPGGRLEAIWDNPGWYLELYWLVL